MDWLNDEADVLAHIEDDIAIGAFEMSRMNAETMRRNAQVYNTARDLLQDQDTVSVEQIQLVTGMPAKDVSQAVESLRKQRVMDVDNVTVSAVRPFRY